MAMTDCPTSEALARYEDGTSTDAEASQIRSHIEHCGACAALVHQSDDRYGDLINHLKGLDLSSEFGDSKGTVEGEDGELGSGRPADAGSKTKLPKDGMIPGYKILREIHHGGQGVVFQALQLSTKRKVAIKVLLEGPYASSSARKRFEREIELVAGLKHPHIVSIFDSGETKDGRQYCVMDYIRGLPFDAYIKDAKLTMEDALRLFAKLCDAVNYAHQKGVIHRDLKPSNILVDGDGEPRVLDFGLARQLVSREETMLSLSGQVVGTLPYLSPEQAEGNPDKVDIRSDVYALGVIMFEMLTGQYPYPVYGQLADVLNHISNTEASAPSKMWESSTGIKHYSQEGRVVEHCPIDDEVNTIVMRVLAKERERRYQTAAELALDIRRYLADEPIEAKRDSSWYVLRKRVKRYKVGVAVAAVVLCMAIIALVVTANLYRTAERDRLAADRAREKAEIETNKARQTVAFTNDMLAGVDPKIAKGMDTRLLRMILDRAATRVQSELADQPAVAASVYSTIGRTYMAIGSYDDAQRYLQNAVDLSRRELGPDHAETVQAKDRLANAYLSAGDYEKAEKLFIEALTSSKRTMGDEHHDTLIIINNLAILYTDMGRLDEAESMLNRALELRRRVNGDDDVQTLVVMHNMAGVYEATARYDEAEDMLRKTVEARRRVLGEDHPATLDTAGNLAKLLDSRGRPAEAETMLIDILAAHRQVYGPEHPATLKVMNNLSNVYMTLGRLSKSEQLCVETLEAMQRVFGDEHPETLSLMNNLANLYYRSGRNALAEPLFQEALAVRRRTMGANHPSTLFSMSVLGRFYSSNGRIEEAEALLGKALNAQVQQFGATHPDVLLTKGMLADLYLAQENFEKAEPLQRQVLEARRDVLGPDHADTLVSMNNLALTLARAGKLEAAEPIFRDALERRERVFGIDHAETLRVQSNLMLVIRKLGREDEARAIQRELLEREIVRARSKDASAFSLNETAWTLLTVEPKALRNPEAALELSLRGNEMTKHNDPGQLDTLALAYFMTGDAEQAARWEQKAIELLPPGETDIRAEFEANLAKYIAAAASQATTQPAD